MYALTNTNIAGIRFSITKYVVVLAIMDMVSAKSDVNSPKEKSMFLATLNWKVTKKQNKKHQKHIDPVCNSASFCNSVYYR